MSANDVHISEGLNSGSGRMKKIRADVIEKWHTAGDLGFSGEPEIQTYTNSEPPYNHVLERDQTKSPLLYSGTFPSENILFE